MLGILANSFRTATRTDTVADSRHRYQARTHQVRSETADLRSGAELEAHIIARRRY